MAKPAKTKITTKPAAMGKTSTTPPPITVKPAARKREAKDAASKAVRMTRLVKLADVPELVSTGILSKLLGVTPEWLTRLSREGILPARVGRGEFPFAETLQAYVAHKAEGAQKQSQSTSADVLRDQRAQEIAMKIARQERELIPLADAIADREVVTGTYLASLSGLPARITRIPRDRQRIEAICDEERLRIADLFVKSGKALRTGFDAAEAEPEDDA